METELLFEVEAELSAPITIPDTPEGTRVIIHVTGGALKGPRLKGEVLSSGGDWFLLRPDGVGVLDVRLLLKTDDAENIYMTYSGRATIGAGGIPSALQIAPTFSTSTKGKYAWLNGVQAVGVGAAGDQMTTVRYKVYQVK
jgi:hypothetical protein